MQPGLAEQEEMAMLMAALEHDLSVLIQGEYTALLNLVCEDLAGRPN
jgi:hypothetical protein